MKELIDDKKKDSAVIANGTGGSESSCDKSDLGDVTGENNGFESNNDAKTVNGCKNDLNDKIKEELEESEKSPEKATKESTKNGVSDDVKKSIDNASDEVGIESNIENMDTVVSSDKSEPKDNNSDEDVTDEPIDSTINTKMPIKEPDKGDTESVDNAKTLLTDKGDTESVNNAKTLLTDKGDTESVNNAKTLLTDKTTEDIQVSPYNKSQELEPDNLDKVENTESNDKDSEVVGKTDDSETKVKEIETESDKMETSESGADKVSDTKTELPDALAELGEQSDSTGPPSLTKEVDTDSLASELHRGEEPMELSEEVSNVANVVSKEENKPAVLENQLKSSETTERIEVDEDGKGKTDDVDAKQEKTMSKDNKTVEPDKPSTVTEKTPSRVEHRQGQKLDQLLSKITQKAENEEKKAPRQAKARKSCATATSSSSSSSSSSTTASVSKPVSNSKGSLAGLTFNVKELEKQGVLDIPKPSKRKAFEPVKIPSPEKVQSPVRSPVRSPIMKKKLMKHRRKKGKRLGAYRLPGEKNHKRINKNRKTESEERESVERALANTSETSKNSVFKESNDPTTVSIKAGDSETAGVYGDKDTNNLSDQGKVSQSNAASIDSGSDYLNAFKMMSKNSKRSFASTSTPIFKKAKKTVKPGIDPSTHRTLESFLKTGSHTQVVSPGSRKVCTRAKR